MLPITTALRQLGSRTLTANAARGAGATALVAAQRTIYIKKAPPPNKWTKIGVDEAVLDLLFDHANVAPEQITLEKNLIHELLLSRQERFGFQWDLQEKFQFQLPPSRRHTRDLQSGREAADWVASILEENNRLLY
ncbi:hypothetical protein HK102_003592 [Quaeritorhiza haematococci]|nr:hypothetical protein HK102_003592 [Quaeritorhiza haematococci]